MSKEEKQIKEIIDNDLDTGRDLVTENYQLEILTLKDKVDLRRFSRAFLKVDKLLKSIFTGKEDKFPKNSGFNKVKTDLVENDTNKVFSAKGAFDLKTYLITNYTTLMNNIRDTLTNSINTKLPHGGYNQSAQTLKNEIDDRYTKSQTDSRYPRFLGTIGTSTNLDLLTQSGYLHGQVVPEMLGGFSVYTWGLFVVERSEDACVQTYYSHQYGHIIRRVGYGSTISWQPWYRVYTSLQKPTSTDIGAVSKSGDTMTGTLTIDKNWADIKLTAPNAPEDYRNKYLELDETGTLNILTRSNSNQVKGKVTISPGKSGEVYHTGNKPTPSDIGTYLSTEIDNTFSKGKGRLPTFDGTFGDFNNKISNGIYYVDLNNADGLNLPSGTYRYGTLIVNKSDGNPVNVIYISDGTQNFLVLNVFNFLNSPSTKITPERWYTVYTSRSKPNATDVGLGNVSNVAQVTDIRMSGNTKVTTWNKAIDTYASGRVQTGSWKDVHGENLDGVYYATLQKCVNGTWYTVAVV